MLTSRVLCAKWSTMSVLTQLFDYLLLFYHYTGNNEGIDVQDSSVDAPATPQQAPSKVANTASAASPIARILAMSNNSVDEMEAKFEEGYDSDGEIGPFNFVEESEGEQLVDEVTVGENSSEAASSVARRTTGIVEPTAEELQQGGIRKFVHISDAAIDKMKVIELQDELSGRGLTFSGRKAELHV